MERGDVTEHEFLSSQAMLATAQDEIIKTRHNLIEVEDALSTLHVKYEEQQTALSSAMAGWTDAANLKFLLVQQLSTSEAKLCAMEARSHKISI